MTYSSEVLADSPYFYWRLGDPSGTVATDSSGNARNGTYTNGPTLGSTSLIATDLTNTAVTFDGVNDYINSSVTNDPASFSVEFWMKSSTGTPGGAFLVHRWPSSSGSRVWYIIAGTTNTQFGVKNASALELTATHLSNLNNGVAHHVVGTYDGSNIRIYVDGTLSATTALAGPLNATGTPFQAAAQAGAVGQFNGVLDEIAYYTTVLSGARILAHYQAGTVAPPVITTASLPDGTRLAPYSTTLTAAGSPTGTWTAAPLPAGLSLNASTGAITGTPTVVGDTSVTIGFTETATGLSATPVVLNLHIEEAPAPIITTTSLPPGMIDTPYEATLEVTGESGVWSITSGTLPDGLTLDPDTGIISGTPTVEGESCFEVTYTEDESELSDTVPLCITILGPPAPPSGDVSGCNCAEDWRLELVDLATGQRRGWLPFLSLTFDDLLDQVGAATVTLPVRKVNLPDIWPHLRAVVFTRISGPDATPSAPVCEYIGMIETVRADSGGTVQLGLQSIEYYLSYRTLTGDTSYTSMDQNEICVELMALGSGSGIPLSGAFEASAYTRTRSWDADDDAVILEKILEITQAIRGPDYRRVFTFASGAWSTVLRFADYVGNTDPQRLNAVRGLVSYGISVEAGEHANWVRGRDQSGHVYTEDTYMTDIYPRFNKAVKYSDVTLNDTLTEQVQGYLANNSDPIAIPDATVADLNISARFKVGDSIDLNMDHGAIRYQGVARLVGKSWSIDPETPSLCTFSFVPLENAHTTILGAPPGNGAGCC